MISIKVFYSSENLYVRGLGTFISYKMIWPVTSIALNLLDGCISAEISQAYVAGIEKVGFSRKINI